MQEIKKIKNLLQDNQSNLIKEFCKSKKKVNKPVDKSILDSSFTVQQELIDDFHNKRIRNKLEHVTKAIQRIENGTYGICIKCRKPIEKERLQIVPQTLYCITCAKKTSFV